MRTLYPAIEPDVVERLDVGDGHVLHVEACGDVRGIPVVFLHGGPGSGCKADHRQFFDPTRYRVILFDQRGAGRSAPYGALTANTTPHLVADLERIRAMFGFERWTLFGGSWGAALALAYAGTHPERVRGMILRGSFLARPRDLAWFLGDGANRLLPRAWAAFVEALAAPPGTDLVEYLHAGLHAADPATVERHARAWEAWTGAVVMYAIDQAPGDAAGPLEAAVAKARIELHYARHGYFLGAHDLLAIAAHLPRMPVRLVHGARDITCPSESAWLLHRSLPGSQLEILRTAGHLSSEAPMIDALVRATDEFTDLLR